MDLVLDNLKLVKYIANKYASPSTMSFDDCFQEGCIGLMRAAAEYKEGKTSFSSFAGMHIQWAITLALRGNKLVHVPTNIVDIAVTITKRKLNDEPLQ